VPSKGQFQVFKGISSLRNVCSCLAGASFPGREADRSR